MIQRSILILMTLLVALPAVAGPTSRCWEMSRLVYQNAPYFIYTDQPDSLLSMMLEWEDVCGEAEPVMRLKVLASIWDGAFLENIYSSRIIDGLIWRYDESRQQTYTKNVPGDLAPGGIAGPADFAFGIASFDTFTTDLANQLLPHTEVGTVQQFFCLFYSGEVDLAFEMLHGDDLNGTDLQWYYQREMSYLKQNSPLPILAFTGGHWRPEGNLVRVGAHAQWGATLGVRHDRWLGRLVCEIRPGRTDYPYEVDDGEYQGMSNRFDNVFLGLEVGRELVSYGPHRFDIFLGLGFDGIKPFWEEDLILGTVNLGLGFGYRVFMGSAQNWIVGADVRFETIGARNAGGTDLSGEATCVRFSLGYSFDSGKGRRLSGMGH